MQGTQFCSAWLTKSWAELLWECPFQYSCGRIFTDWNKAMQSNFQKLLLSIKAAWKWKSYLKCFTIFWPKDAASRLSEAWRPPQEQWPHEGSSDSCIGSPVGQWATWLQDQSVLGLGGHLICCEVPSAIPRRDCSKATTLTIHTVETLGRNRTAFTNFYWWLPGLSQDYHQIINLKSSHQGTACEFWYIHLTSTFVCSAGTWT